MTSTNIANTTVSPVFEEQRGRLCIMQAASPHLL